MPITLNSIHDALNHEHTVCNSKIEQHIHQKDIDCSLHLLKQSSSFLTSLDYSILLNTNISKDVSTQYSFLKNHYQLSFSLRGPPLYVQA
ncbi:hypothetical protein [Polaribacter sp.]|uniref:hypothetical protein n=1 Tax=Polaribacter sp. TaxID=1920175 RepID=UPI003F6C7430